MEIQTKRGFVLKIEIGRAGLVTVKVIHDDGTIGVYVINDLDADPERFNERLSKLAILRDAMNRAEPVEIEHASGEAGQVIERAARISRDALGPVQKVEKLMGLVLEVALHAENGTLADGEKHDIAKVRILSPAGTADLILDMQAPERLVAVEQLEMIREAHQYGYLAHFWVDVGAAVGSSNTGTVAQQTNRIIAVALDYNIDALGDDRAIDVNGFVESLSMISLGLGSQTDQFAHVRFTTAPPFTGPGGTVGLTPFTPTTLDFLVHKNSPNYALFEAGLRDNLRMRVRALMLYNRNEKGEDTDPATDATAAAKPVAAAAHARIKTTAIYINKAQAVAARLETLGLVLSAELLANLASASRPVWITVSRKSLDHGPDGFDCTTGVPTSDLMPSGLRDLRIPYPAVWTGIGCFNPGIYRFQLRLPTTYKLLVDGKELCLHDADKEEVRMAHACLCGEHEVMVKIENWICDYEFDMDVYQLR